MQVRCHELPYEPDEVPWDTARTQGNCSFGEPGLVHNRQDVVAEVVRDGENETVSLDFQLASHTCIKK